MDKLPPELLAHVLLFLSPESLPDARLTCHAFNAVLAPKVFRTLPQFFHDLAVGQQTLLRMASKPSSRPRCIWSPYSVAPPYLGVEDGFLAALYTALTGRTWDAVRMGGISGEAIATAIRSETGNGPAELPTQEMGQKLGHEIHEIRRLDTDTELAHKLTDGKRMCQVQHKYSLYLSYVQGSMERYHRADLLPPRFWLN